MKKINDKFTSWKKNFLEHRVKKDNGAANTVSFIVIIFFVMVLLLSMIDMGVYFNVKNEMRSAAEAGARNVALYGGTSSPLRGVRGATSAEEVVKAAMQSNFSSILKGNPSIECGPGTTAAAGDEVWCKVSYNYKGIAGKFSLFEINDSAVTVKGTTVSEVSVK